MYVCQRRPRRRFVRLKAARYSNVEGRICCAGELSIAYLSSRNDLKGSERGLEVGSASLKVVESSSNLSLELGRLCARWAVRRDLVEGTHGCCCREVEKGVSKFLASF